MSTPERISHVRIMHLRDAAILELLFATGARVSELCNLDIAHYDEASLTIRILGKG